MRMHRVLFPLMALFLFTLLPMPMIEQAYANCCNPRLCGYWGLMMYGVVDLQDNMAHITIGKESYSIEVEETFLKRLKEEKDQRMAQALKEPAHGLIIVHGFGDTAPKKLMVTDFLPADPVHHHRKVSVQEAVNNYKNFKQYKEDLKEYRTKK